MKIKRIPFWVVAPQVWNSLPLIIRTYLKTFRAYRAHYGLTSHGINPRTIHSAHSCIISEQSVTTVALQGALEASYAVVSGAGDR